MKDFDWGAPWFIGTLTAVPAIVFSVLSTAPGVQYVYSCLAGNFIALTLICAYYAVREWRDR